MLPLRRLLGPTVALALIAPLHATRDDGEPAPAIRATVTAESGDIGGTFFGRTPPAEKVRRYFIAAEPVRWDFTPAGRDDVCGLPLPGPVIAQRVREKLRYIQYTDATFTQRVIPNPSLGVMGPVLRGVVGDYLVVTFRNRTTVPVSMHPHGVRYDRDSEGAYHFPTPGRGAAVGPGATFTYVWHLDADSGPRADEPSSKGWLYHSHVSGDTETNLGLMGGLIVTDPKRARPDGTPADVDREFAALFMIFDESEIQTGPVPPAGAPPAVAAPRPATTWAQTQEAVEAGQRFSINGYLFGNLRGLDMNEGERTRWYLFGLGSERDFHTAHWHGLRALEEGRRRTDVIELLPATMKVADLLADNPGSWLFHCHVAEHMREGMFARFNIYARNAVGVSRAPEAAFLGHPAATRSIRIQHAESVLNLATRPARGELQVTGTATAPDGLNVTGQTLRVALGRHTVEFRPGDNATAKLPGARLRVLNADETGVIRGGLIEFEIAFNGPEWLDGAETTAPVAGAPSPAPTRSLPFSLEISGVEHRSTVTFAHRIIGN